MANLNYFEQIARYRVKQRRKHRYYWDDITKYIDYFSNENLSVLEVGTGTGELLATIKAKRKVGIDFSESMLDIAKTQYPEIDFHLMSAEDIKLNEKFDLIILSNLIGFTDDVQCVFEQLKKVAHSRTKIIVTYYNHFWEPLLKFSEFIGLKAKTPTQNWLSISDVRNLLKLSDFDVYRESRRIILPFNIPIISYFFNRILANLPIIKHLCLNNFSFACLPHETESKEYSVSIVIPARNESGNIETGLLETIRKLFITVRPLKSEISTLLIETEVLLLMIFNSLMAGFGNICMLMSSEIVFIEVVLNIDVIASLVLTGALKSK